MLAAYRAGTGIRVRRAACLTAGPGGVSCSNCRTVCPVGAVSISSTGPSIGAECLGCGRCASQCPTGALKIDVFTARAQTLDCGDLTVIACERAAKIEGKSPDCVVRCLGALSPADWLQLIGQAVAKPLWIIDPGLCAACPAGKSKEPWAPALGEVARLLQVAGLPADLEPTVAGCSDRVIEAEPSLARRRLIGLVAPLRTRVVEIAASTTKESKRRARDLRRQVEAIEVLAQRRACQPTHGAMPEAKVTESCDGCGICMAVCPTPALQVSVGASGAEKDLTFEGAECLRCGRCTRVCPRQAITISDHGGSGERAVIHSLSLRACSACGDDFTPEADEQLCVICQRSASLGGDLLFGPASGRRGLIHVISTEE